MVYICEYVNWFLEVDYIQVETYMCTDETQGNTDTKNQILKSLG